ncbi:MAG: DUF86 domain-containing protein [Polyangia bacterium]|jgi:uncharacterized protein YutE (UPF0331/DUF86 family)
MVRVDLVRDKIGRLRDTAAWLRACLPEQASAMAASRDVRDLVSFRVYLVMQEAIDLCSHVIADQGWGPVPSLRDHFGLLAEKGVLSSDLAGRLSAGVKLRNLVGHGYAEVDPTKMQAAASELAGLVDPFCNAILAFAESHPS